MNERIKELEKQCWSHRVDGALIDGHLHFDTKKFAELIVQECIKEVEGLQVSDWNQNWNQAIAHTALHLKEHFGVEE